MWLFIVSEKMSYGMVKPMPIMLVRHQGSLEQARWHTQYNGQWEDHDIKVWGGKVNKFMFNRDCDQYYEFMIKHWKIMSYNVIKKMTKSAAPDHNVMSKVCSDTNPMQKY